MPSINCDCCGNLVEEQNIMIGLEDTTICLRCKVTEVEQLEKLQKMLITLADRYPEELIDELCQVVQNKAVRNKVLPRKYKDEYLPMFIEWLEHAWQEVFSNMELADAAIKLGYSSLDQAKDIFANSVEIE